MSVAAALLLLLASTTSAWAQDEAPGYAALLDQAKAAIVKSDFKAARALLVQAEAAAPTSAALIQEKDLARLPFYKGLVEWRNGDKDTAALNHWRDAITLTDKFEPEADVLPEAEGQDVYYALMGEVKGRESVVLALPEDPGDTMIFVDGRRMEPFDAVLVGTHFVQLRCGEGNVVGSWYTYGAPPPDYLVLCSGGAYPVTKAGGKPPKAPKGPSKAELAKAEKAAAKQAAAEKAAAKEAAAKEAADKAAADKAAAAEKAAADKAAADKAAADKASADKAAADKAAAEKVATDKASADKAAADKASADKAATDKAATDKAAADKASADKAAADKASADKAAADKASADKAATDKAAADKATADKATADKAAADKTAADKATADKAAADKATADKAAADKAAADKASADADKAAAAKAAADKAAADKAAKATARADKPKKDGTVGWVMIGGGGALIGGGALVNFLVVNPAFDEATAANLDPSTVTRAEADTIVSRFETGRYATIGLIAAGVATAGVGVFLGPLESHVFITPTGAGIAGRW